MTQRFPLFIAAFLAAAALPAFAQTQPIHTGEFPSGPAPVTLVLLNQSRLSDSTLADIANSLNGKMAGVALATRLFGIGVCGQGEWCLAVTDQMVANGSDAVAGAAVGSAIAREIVRVQLAKIQL